jgi:hypothetical protein
LPGYRRVTSYEPTGARSGRAMAAEQNRSFWSPGGRSFPWRSCFLASAAARVSTRCARSLVALSERATCRRSSDQGGAGCSQGQGYAVCPGCAASPIPDGAAKWQRFSQRPMQEQAWKVNTSGPGESQSNSALIGPDAEEASVGRSSGPYTGSIGIIVLVLVAIAAILRFWP